MSEDKDPNTTGRIDLLEALQTYRQAIAEERWLTTHILHAHLEVEACLVELLKRHLKKPEKLLENNRTPNFAMLLSFCEALDLVKEELGGAIRALNRLRNSAAHVLNYHPDIKDLAHFIAAVSNIYPLEIKKSDSEEPKRLGSFQQVKEHFEGVELPEAVEMLFISLRLLHVTVINLVDPEKNTSPQPPRP